jgi:hypothetical protein
VAELVVVVPLKPGTADRARELLAGGPPFELAETEFRRHAVHMTEREVVFVFDAEGKSTTLTLDAEDPALLEAAAAWREVMEGKPRVARLAFSWERPDSSGDVFYEPTPGPGDSDGGEVYSPGQ